jgi:hypothetical protein
MSNIEQSKLEQNPGDVKEAKFTLWYVESERKRARC